MKSKKMGRKSGQKFWDQEYKTKGEVRSGGHLALSTNPSEDLVKFTRFLQRREDDEPRSIIHPQSASVLDLGCGNGRNLIYMAHEFSMEGIGYDISGEAVAQAKLNSADLPISYEVRSIAGDFANVPSESQSIVLDMMTSHFLNQAEREYMYKEIYRVLKPEGWLFLKTFLRDDDRNAARMIRENPGEERGSYIHPEIGVAEHTFTEQEIVSELSKHFSVEKKIKSFKHLKDGRAWKRRSICLYAKKEF